jgi:hypothetical protein
MTEVKIGNYTCRALKKTSKCTVKNVPSGKTYKVSARAKNRNGYGTWSAGVSFRAIAGKQWRRDSAAPWQLVTTVPRGSPSNGSGVVTTTVPVEPTKVDLKLDLSGLIALGVSTNTATSASAKKFSTSSNSNLMAIDTQGSLKSPVTQGNAVVSRVLLAPNDLIYLVFEPNSTAIAGGLCLIAVVSRSDGTPTCIEQDLNFLPQNSPLGFTNFQFDQSGAIYYVGSPNRSRIGTDGYFKGWSTSTNLVVRRVKSGSKTDFGFGASADVARNGATRDITFVSPSDGPNLPSVTVVDQGVSNFLVLPDGTLLIDQDFGDRAAQCGTTCGQGSGYGLFVYRTDGTSAEVGGFPEPCAVVGVRCNRASVLGRMADGRVLVGADACLCVVNPQTWTFDSRRWYSTRSSNSEYVSPSTCSAGVDLPLMTRRILSFFCDWGANSWKYSWTTPEGKTFAVVGSNNRCFHDANNCRTMTESYLRECCWTGILTQMFPTFSHTTLGGSVPSRELENIDSFVAVLSSVVASGTTSSGGYRTVIYDTNSTATRELIPESSGIRVDEMVFSASTNSVVFVGLNTATTQKISGVIDLVSGRFRTTSLGSGGLTGIVSIDSR